MFYSKEKIEKTVKAKGYAWFENGDFNLNIVGVRNSNTGNKVSNLFDDILTLSYKIGEVWQYNEWTITTDPGKKAVLEFHNPNGVARVVPGQYRGSHQIGLHQGKYEALKQKGNIKVYRDKNKDMQFDTNTIEEGSAFGINIHHSSFDGTSTYVENWSEGCQVFANINSFNTFMDIVRKAEKIHGNSFTYTLLESKDLL